jgi:hypothetical protein
MVVMELQLSTSQMTGTEKTSAAMVGNCVDRPSSFPGLEKEAVRHPVEGNKM